MSTTDPLFIPRIGSEGSIEDLPGPEYDRFADELVSVAQRLNQRVYQWMDDPARTPNDSFRLDDLLAAQASWLVGHRAGESTAMRSILRMRFCQENIDTCATNVARLLAWGTTDVNHMMRSAHLDWWFDANCPVVCLGEQVAAGLALTSVPKSIVESDVRVPWKAFTIRLPLELIPSTKAGVSYERIEVCRLETGDWAVTAIDTTHHCDQSVRKCFQDIAMCPEKTYLQDPSEEDLSEMVRRSVLEQRDIDEVVEEFQQAHQLPMPRFHRTRYLLIGRIVAGVIFLMTQPNSLRLRRAPKGQRGRERWLRKGDPKTTDYVLLPPAGLRLPDTVSALRQLLHAAKLETGRGSIQLLQWMVRGHWRWQACGEGLKDRRLIWIAPYWKGPDTAKRLVREHEIRDPRG